jgi:hypothetical protein
MKRKSEQATPIDGEEGREYADDRRVEVVRAE